MAALSMTSAKVQIPKAKLGAGIKGLRKSAVAPKAAKVARSTVAAAVSGDVPDMGKRNVMNLLLVGGYAYFFVPPRWVIAAPRARRPRADPAA